MERLGLEAWRRTELEEMQLGTYSGTGRVELGRTQKTNMNNVITHDWHIFYLQSSFGIFVVVLTAPFPWKSLFLFGTVKCRCLGNIRESTVV